MGQSDKLTKIKMHDAYANFLSHLFEFYIACEQRDRSNTKKLDNEFLDKFFNAQVKRQLRNKCDAIEKGYAPEWENHISCYQVEVPEDFGKDFRLVRNRTSHALIDRSVPEKGIPLADFYHRYHKFAYLLYYTGSWWRARNIENYNWQAIEEFDLSVKRSGVSGRPI